MNNKRSHRTLLTALALLIAYPALASGPGDSPSSEEILSFRAEVLGKFSQASEVFSDELERRTKDSMRQKEDFFRDFYDDRIEKLESESKTQNANIVYSLNSFIAQHPRDSKTPYALLKLAQIYLEEADNTYRWNVENYKGDGPLPQKDLSLALNALEKIKDNFPSFEHMDSALYLLGYAYLNSKDPKPADLIYERLAREHPESPYAPEAFLRTGEHHFSLRDFRKAVYAYQTVLKYPGETLKDKALYKLAWSHYLMGNYDNAIKNFIALAELAPKSGEDQILKDFKKDALMYIAFSLYRKGSVKNSISFLDSLSGKHYAYAVTKNLGDIYNDRDLFSDAASVYRNLLAAHPLNGENPSVATSLIFCLKKLNAASGVKGEWRSAILAFRPGSRWRLKNIENKEANGVADALLEESLYSLSIELDKAGRREKNAALVSEAIDLYTRLASYFPKGEKSYNGLYYAGEGYAFLGKPDKALEAYDEVLKNNYYSRYYAEALFSQIIIYERMLEKDGGLKAYKVDEKTAGSEITGLPAKLLSACDHFLEKAPDDGRVPKVMYHSADILEHFMRTDGALKRYSFILEKHRGSPFAQDSLKKILNIYTRIGEYAKVAREGGIYLKAPYFENPKLTEEVYELVAYAEYNIGRVLEKNGKHLEASAYLRNVAREYPRSKVAGNSVLAAFENLEKSKDYKAAKSGLEELLRENPESKLVPRIIFELATRADDGLDFETAVSYYGQIEARYPDSEEAKESLARKAMLYETLEEYSKAGDLYLSYASSLPQGDLNREAILKAVINYRDADRFAKVLGKEQTFASSLKGDDLKMAFLYLATAEHHMKSNSRSACLRYLALGERSLKRSAFSTPEINHMLLKIKVGLLEKRLDEFKSIKLSFPQKRFIASLDKKAAALEELENEYLGFVKEGTPSTSSQALYRLAQAYENFGRSITSAKIPDSLDQAQKENLKKELSNLGEPLLTKARSAYMKNIQDAKERRYINEWIRSSVESFSAMIESETMLPPLALDYRYRFEAPVFIFPLITDPGYPKPEKLPKSPLAKRLFEEGVSLLDKTDRNLEALRRASFLFGEASRLDQDFKAARFNKACIMQELGNYDVAQFIYGSIEKDPAFRDMVRTNTAAMHLSEGNPDKATKILSEILKEKPDDTNILSDLAYALRIKGDKNSITFSREVLEIKPFDELAYNNIAMIYLESGKIKSAERILERSLEKGKSMITLNNLAAIKIMQGDLSSAHRMLSEILKENPGDRTALSNTVHVLLRTQNYEEGLSFAKNLWENYGENKPELYINLGLAYMSLQKNREAIDHMNANLRFAGPYGSEAKSMIFDLKKTGEKQ